MYYRYTQYAYLQVYKFMSTSTLHIPTPNTMYKFYRKIVNIFKDSVRVRTIIPHIPPYWKDAIVVYLFF